jgi:hypothetical protein
MTENSELNRIMNEMVASLSENSREGMMRRINSERLIKMIAESLVERHEAEAIRVILDNRLTDQDAADYLVQVDDYDMRLILLDSPDGKVQMSENLLQDWITLLEANPSTTIIIAVWANDDLLAIPFTMRRLKAVVESRDQTEKITKIAKPFEAVISEQIQRQTKGWKIPKVEQNKPAAGKRDLYSIFSQKVISSIDNEAGRRYRTEERVKAARNFPGEQEKRVLLNVLQEALDGATSKELENKLTKLPRRGEQ